MLCGTEVSFRLKPYFVAFRIGLNIAPRLSLDLGFVAPMLGIDLGHLF